MPIDGLFVILRYTLIDISRDKVQKQIYKYISSFELLSTLFLNLYTYQTKDGNIIQSISA